MELLQVMLMQVDALGRGYHWIEQGRRVAEAMERAEYMSQEELAQRIGSTQTTVSDICVGKSRGKKHLAKIAQALGVTVEWLMTGKDAGDDQAPSVQHLLRISQLQDQVIQQRDLIDRLSAELAHEKAENARLARELAAVRASLASDRSTPAP